AHPSSHHVACRSQTDEDSKARCHAAVVTRREILWDDADRRGGAEANLQPPPRCQLADVARLELAECKNRRSKFVSVKLFRRFLDHFRAAEEGMGVAKRHRALKEQGLGRRVELTVRDDHKS